MAVPSVLLEELEDMPRQLERTLRVIPPARLSWRPESWEGCPSETFSAIEQVCHLRDIERDGYHVRIRRMLTESEPSLVSLESYELARERHYEGARLEETGPESLIGVWRGTSTCTDRVAAPACNDETVVYEFTAGATPGTVHWQADKVVEGKRQTMGTMELTYDAAEACWKAEFSSPRVKTVWRLAFEGTHLTGTGRLLPGNQTVRKVDLRKQ